MFEDCEMDFGRFVSECADSPSLQTIQMEGVAIQPGDFKDLNRWSHLKYLYLRNAKIHPETVRDIAKVKSLEVVGFSEMEISDEVIAAIVESDAFASLILERTNLTEHHVSQLCQCQNLRRLNIYATSVPASAIRFLEQSNSLEKVFALETPLGKGIDEKELSNGCVIQGSEWRWKE